MTTTVELITNDVAAAMDWQSLHVTESIGQPDTMTLDVYGFMEGAADITAPVLALFANDNYFYACARDGSEIIFSGLVRRRGGTKPAKGLIRWSLSGTGWEFLVPKWLVGVPDGTEWITEDDDDPDTLPNAIAVDPPAIGQPTAASVKALWEAYFFYPPQIDLDTYVFDILPAGASVDDITWSGSDLAGATSDLAAYGSAAAMWWLANDSPNPQNITAPNLALHFGLVVLPDATDDGDMLMGFLTAPIPGETGNPVGAAPFAIDNDAPNFTTRIMAVSTDFDFDDTDHDHAAYVRGATGYTEDILPGVGAMPYQVGPVIEGGTGWVGARGGPWGDTYLDAPAAINPAGRDAFGEAYLLSRATTRITGTIVIPPGYAACHKGQGIQVTDADWGFAARWFLIHGVEREQKTPLGDFEQTLSVGDALTVQLGYALRQQRLKEARKEIAPATKFIPYNGDLLLAPGETAPLVMQLATEGGVARQIAGVPARWGLLVNGVDLTDPEDVSGAFFLTNVVAVTDAIGQIKATMNAGATSTAADAAWPWAKIAGSV